MEEDMAEVVQDLLTTIEAEKDLLQDLSEVKEQVEQVMEEKDLPILRKNHLEINHHTEIDQEVLALLEEQVDH
ncbi:MAG: hypothetical protein WCJ39_06370 [bacterium]